MTSVRSVGGIGGCTADDRAGFSAGAADFLAHGHSAKPGNTLFQRYPRGLSVLIMSTQLTS